ncbi:MAG: family 1 glycosylhydrolase [Chlamydiota bacterium]
MGIDGIGSCIDDTQDVLTDWLAESLSPSSKDSWMGWAVRPLFAPVYMIGSFYLGLGQLCVALFRLIGSVFEETASAKEDFSVVGKDASQWEKIDVDNQLYDNSPLKDLPSFGFGVAGAAYQRDPEYFKDHAQWYTHAPPSKDPAKPLPEWHREIETHEGRQALLARLQKLKVNTYRMSVALPVSMKQGGDYDEKKISQIVATCKLLRDNEIRIEVTLHHFAEPNYFFDAGSFHNQQNVHEFVLFAKKVIPILTQDHKGEPLVQCIYTFNEIGVDGDFSRKVRGAFPPFHLLRFREAFEAAGNMLAAHNKIYTSLKGKISEKVKIGMTHQVLRLVPVHPLLYPITYVLEKIANGIFIDYFRTGVFACRIPFIMNEKHTVGPYKGDVLGIQVYTRAQIGITGSVPQQGFLDWIVDLGRRIFGLPRPNMTKMPFWEDPYAIYDAILDVRQAFHDAQRKMECKVTEFGISTDDSEQRARYMRRSVHSVGKAICEAVRRIVRDPRALEMYMSSEKYTKENYTFKERLEIIGPQILSGILVWTLDTSWEWDDPKNVQSFGIGTPEGNPKEGIVDYIAFTGKCIDHAKRLESKEQKDSKEK